MSRLIRVLIPALRLALICACATPEVHARAAQKVPALSYRLAPVLVQGRLTALDMSMSFDVPSAYAVRIRPPQAIGETGPSRKITVIAVRSGRLTVARDRSWLVHADRGQHHVEIDYRISPATGEAAVGGNGYKAVLMGEHWFQALGENLFASPAGEARGAASFEWKGPADWRFISQLDDLANASPLTLENLLQTTVVGGTEVRSVSRPTQGGVLTVAAVGSWNLPLDEDADVAASVISAQRAFWNDSKGNYLVTIVALDRHDAFNAGVGRDGAFAAYVARKVDRLSIRALITHEYTHMWIPRRTGRMPDGDREALAYWFSEGFTVFRTNHAMLQSGAWTLQNFANDFNSLSTRYGMSPARHIANREVANGFWKSGDVQGVPYERGAIFAWLLDARLRQRTHGRHTMNDVLRHMRDRFSADPSLGVRENLAQSYVQQGGGSIEDWLHRYIDQGQQMILPQDLFAGCLKMLQENKPGVGKVQSVMVEPGLDASRTKECIGRIGDG